MNIKDREQFRTNFSLEFMTGWVAQNTGGCTHDPRNHIGHKCGINGARVYQRWTDHWTGVMQDV
jgi:hypothetical protein